MKKNLNIIIVISIILTIAIVAVIVVGMTMPSQKEIIQGQDEATDYSL